MSYDQFRNITIQQMESLIYLVEEGSFSRAAKRVFLTQPSLTKHIKNLEEAVNAKIVNRENMGISLTLKSFFLISTLMFKPMTVKKPLE
jgi:hypothetical protein